MIGYYQRSHRLNHWNNTRYHANIMAAGYGYFFFILTVFTAGFCEEIVYRGYAITKLIDIRVNKWLVIIPAGIAFTLTHGIVAVTAYSQFFFYFAFAVVFGVIFVSGKRLLPNMIIHILFDLTAMMAIFQAISG